MGDLEPDTGRVDDPRQADMFGAVEMGHAPVTRTNGHHAPLVPSGDIIASAQTLGKRPQAFTDIEVQDEPPIPLEDFIRTKKGEIRPLFSNVVHLLQTQGQQWGLCFDSFAQRPVCRGRYLDDPAMRAIAEWVQNSGVHAAMPTIQDAILRATEAKRVHPIRQYLRGLHWDQTPRLDHFLIDHAGADDDPSGLNRAFTRRWMIQAVARVMEPGCHARAMLILEGPQDIGKSTIFRELFGRRYFTDHLPDLASKDAVLQLRGAWCIEVAELATFDKHAAARIKAFVTAREDKVRDPYGRATSDVPRQTVFGGTVNPGAIGYLKDETGGTRFWPIRVNGPVDLEAIVSTRDQLWAEAFHRYAEGEPWWFLADEDAAIVDAAREVQAARFEGDPWMERIAAYVDTKEIISTEDIFMEVLAMREPADWDQRALNRVGKCLSALGWERYQKKIDGKPRSRYRKAQVTGTGDRKK